MESVEERFREERETVEKIRKREKNWLKNREVGYLTACSSPLNGGFQKRLEPFKLIS